MWNSRLFVGLLLAVSAPAAFGQMGKNVLIQAGTPEGTALDKVNAASEPAQKLPLIEKFAEDFGKGDLEIVADDLYVNYFLAVKNYDKAIEYGEKLWAADPDNFQNGVNLVRAAQEKGDAARLMTYGEKTAAIVARYKALPAPEGRDAGDWDETKKRTLEDAKDSIAYIEQLVFVAAYQSKDAAARAANLVRFANAFPESPRAGQAMAIAAASYQQAEQYAKMLEVANGILTKDPNDVSMMILLADYYSEKGTQFDKAESYAKKAGDLLGAAKRPEGVSDEEWQKQVSLQKGLALSALGMANISRKRDAQAVENFKAAAPLLKSDAFTYGRNQYRMGFALLNLKRIPEARAAFSEAASVDSPYKALAQQKLSTLPAAGATGARKKAS